MRIDVITIFPDMFPGVLGASMLKRAQDAGRLQVHLHDLRDSSHDKHRKVDDRPYGGGPGMVMRVEPIAEALESVRSAACAAHGDAAPGVCQRILTSPGGEPLSTAMAKETAVAQHLTVVCGHYEGVDERVKSIVDRVISIGDYVLTGGELPAMVLIDAVARYIPGVIGHEDATKEESFADGQLEYPQYTRPPVFRGLAVPDVLLSGDHERVAAWRREQSTHRTRTLRPDLFSKVSRQGNGQQKG